MENPELANATWWYWLWELIGTIAFLGVIVTLAIEFGAARLAAPYRKIIDDAKDLKIAELNNETARLRQFIVKAGTPRIPDREKLLAELKDARKASVFIEYARQVPDARQCAKLLWDMLKSAGWPVPQSDGPTPFDELAGGPPLGISVLADHESIDKNDAVNALALAIGAAIEPPVFGAITKSLPPNTVRIIIGFRAPMLPADAPPKSTP